MQYKVIILIEDLAIHYCDPITLESIKTIVFKSIDELENFISSGKGFNDI